MRLTYLDLLGKIIPQITLKGGNAMSDESKRVILEILSGERKWWYGLDLIKTSKGRLGRGTLYVYLNELIDDQLVESRFETDEEFSSQFPEQARRSLYRITRRGLGGIRQKQSVCMSAIATA